MNHKRILALDIGTARIGVAASDAIGITAQPVETIKVESFAKSIARIRELLANYQTDRIVIGQPRNMDGTFGAQAKHSEKYARELESLGYSVALYDERLTTKQARQTLIATGASKQTRDKKQGHVDMLAACLILESFMQAGGFKDIIIKEDITMDENKQNIEDLDTLEIEDIDDTEPVIIELEDEDGKALNFELIGRVENAGKTYICLIPAEPIDDMEEDELVILRIETGEDGEEFYATIEDEAELNAVYERFVED